MKPSRITAAPSSGLRTVQRRPEALRSPAEPQNVAGAAAPPAAQSILHLQRTLGNRATTGIIQAKLRVGAVDDPCEREAERVATRIASGSGLHGIRLPHGPDLTCFGSPSSGEVARRAGGAGLYGIVARPAMTAGFAVPPDFEAGMRLSEPEARPLPKAEGDHMERQFSSDFSDVRLHQGPVSATLNRQIRAKAFTYGRHIYLGDAQTSLQSRAGRHLLAHELTHVVQQNGAKPLRASKDTRKASVPTSDTHSIHTESYGRQGFGSYPALGSSALHGPNEPHGRDSRSLFNPVSGWRVGCSGGIDDLPRASTVPPGEAWGVIQRRVLIGQQGARQDVTDLLPKYGVMPGNWSSWYSANIKPHLSSRYSFIRFKGFLENDSGDYDLTAETNVDPVSLSFAEFNSAVVRAFNIHFWQDRMSKPSRGLGTYTALARDEFPRLIKNAFDKTAVMKITGMESRGIHLRHFVMGSWIRLLPDVVNRAQIDQQEATRLATQIATLIPRLVPYSGHTSDKASGILHSDTTTLATLLHDLEPNLCAGEGPENSLIGFLSHGFSELAIEMTRCGLSVNREDLPELIHHALDAINLVSKEDRAKWSKDFGPVDVFEALLQFRIGDADPAPSKELAIVMHDFAFQLGMDFMKRHEGLSAELQKQKINAIALFQSLLVGIGEKLYSIIIKGQTATIDYTDVAKLVNDIEILADGLASTYPRHLVHCNIDI